MGKRYYRVVENMNNHKPFLEWAALYDNAGVEVRSKVLHEKWMAELSCPILRIEGDYSVEECVTTVKEYLDSRILNLILQLKEFSNTSL